MLAINTELLSSQLSSSSSSQGMLGINTELHMNNECHGSCHRLRDGGVCKYVGITASSLQTVLCDQELWLPVALCLMWADLLHLKKSDRHCRQLGNKAWTLMHKVNNFKAQQIKWVSGVRGLAFEAVSYTHLTLPTTPYV